MGVGFHTDACHRCVRYLGARVTGTLGQRFAADAAVDLPARIRTTATMVVPDYRFRAAVNWRF